MGVVKAWPEFVEGAASEPSWALAFWQQKLSSDWQRGFSAASFLLHLLWPDSFELADHHRLQATDELLKKVSSQECDKTPIRSKKKLRYLELIELDQVEREMFASHIKELDAEADRLHMRKSELEFELNGDHSQTVSYEQVRSLIGRFEYFLRLSTFEQRKTLLHLIGT